MPHETLIIAVWFGEWPAYLPCFLKSLCAVPGFRWLLVSDNRDLPFYPENLQYRQLSLDEFNELATGKLGISVQVSDPKKLCDFKPAYGMIFEEDLTNFDYWGYCDIDIIFGNIGHYLGSMLGKYDVISGYKSFLSGPFCLYRNNISVTGLFKMAPDYIQILQSPDHLAFDENILRKSSGKKRLHRIKYPLWYLFNLPYGSLSIPEIWYQYQWFVKRHESNGKIPGDMTEIVFQQVSKGQISARFRELIHSDRSFGRKGRKTWEIRWDHGTLKDVLRNREIFAFHFVDSKSGDDFHIAPVRPVPDTFTLNETGFQA